MVMNRDVARATSPMRILLRVGLVYTITAVVAYTNEQMSPQNYRKFALTSVPPALLIALKHRSALNHECQVSLTAVE